MKRLIKIILLIIWMTIIYLFSQQNGDDSSKISEQVIKFFHFIGININSLLGYYALFIIRKSAHMFEYFVLSLLFYNLVKDLLQKPYVLSILFSFLYACTDEWHQSFIPNRGPSFIDVLIDTIGATFGILIIWIWNKHKRKMNKQGYLTF